MLGDPSFVLIVAEAQGDCVGLIHGQLMRRLDGAVMFLIYELTVAEEWRRRGIATQLVDAAREAAEANGAVDIWLLTEPDNAEAIGFYTAIGGRSFPAVGYEIDAAQAKDQSND